MHTLDEMIRWQYVHDVKRDFFASHEEKCDGDVMISLKESENKKTGISI